MDAFFFSHISFHRQHSEPFAYPVIQRGLSPAAAAAGISCDEPSFCHFYGISAATAAEPERIPVFCFLPGFSDNRQLSKLISGQISDAFIGCFCTAAAFHDPRLQLPAFHQKFPSAVAAASPDNRISDTFFCWFYDGQLTDADSCQVFISHCFLPAFKNPTASFFL